MTSHPRSRLLSQHLATHPPKEAGVILTTTHSNPIPSGYYSDVIFKAAVRASDGVPDDTASHDLRHHFASVLLEEGVPTNVVDRSTSGTAAVVWWRPPAGI